MRKLKISFSLALMLLLVGMFGAAASATQVDAPGNAPTFNGDLDKTGAEGADVESGVVNANQSGVGTAGTAENADQVLKSDGMTNQDGSTGSQRTHGEYHNNTNSCASCHQTHTAESKSLLFKDGVYSTCTACHDGTLGFYNVFENGNHNASAGTFGGSTEDGNMSAHMVNGGVTVAAAPGGNVNDLRGGTWTGEFNCASCHSPHGSFSDRLLHYNPNDMGNTKPEDGGLKANKVPVINYADLTTYQGTVNLTDAKVDKYVAVRGTKAQHSLTTGYEFIAAGEDVIMIYEKALSTSGGTTTAKYNKTTNPWMYGYPTRGSGDNKHHYYTRFFTANPTTILNADGTYPGVKADQVVDYYDYLDDTAHFKLSKGLIYGPSGSLNTLAFAEIARAYVVKLDLMPINTVLGGDDDSDNNGFKDFGGVPITTVNQRALFAGETNSTSTNILAKWGVTPGVKVSNWGVAMSTYCASCHTDYLAKSGSETGTFNTTSYRHTTTSDSYTCVRCHFAHGTDVEIMRDAQNRTIDEVAVLPGMDLTKATAYMLDKNPSSALKRFTNMAVCWSCHTSSSAEQLKNNDSYSHEEGNSLSDPRGIPTLEGTQNWPTAPITTPVVPTTVVANDQTDVITGLATTMEYSVDGGAWIRLLGGAATPKFTGAKTVKVRIAAVPGVSNVSAEKTLTFTVHTPTAPSVTANDTTNVIVGATTAMEYSVDGGAYTPWTEGTTISGAATVLVRVAAVADVNLVGATKSLTFTAN